MDMIFFNIEPADALAADAAREWVNMILTHWLLDSNILHDNGSSKNNNINQVWAILSKLTVLWHQWNFGIFSQMQPS